MRVVKSYRAGVGKSLKAQRISEILAREHRERDDTTVKVPLHEKEVRKEAVLETLLEYSSPPLQHKQRIFHFDLAHEASQQKGCSLYPILS